MQGRKQVVALAAVASTLVVGGVAAGLVLSQRDPEASQADEEMQALVTTCKAAVQQRLLPRIVEPEAQTTGQDMGSDRYRISGVATWSTDWATRPYDYTCVMGRTNGDVVSVETTAGEWVPK